MNKKAVVLLSGGLDSTTCLAYCLHKGYECYTISFDYGQKHRAELKAAENISKKMGAKRHVTINLGLQGILSSALTSDEINVPEFSDANTVPTTYVPARNMVFLSLALGWAETLAADAIVIGVSSIDYSGYPDCRPDFIDSFANCSSLATKCGVEGNPIKIITPLISLTKAQTIKMGGDFSVDYSLTISCYQATEDGLACGKCDSCVLRQRGFADAGIADATRYVE